MMVMLLLPSVAGVQVSVVPATILVTSVQFAPLSTEPQMVTPVLPSALLSAAVMVWLAVLVTKSVVEVPVSALIASALKAICAVSVMSLLPVPPT